MFFATSDTHASEPVTAAIKWNIVLSRTLTGFMILAIICGLLIDLITSLVFKAGPAGG
jgi:hypothetical protein